MLRNTVFIFQMSQKLKAKAPKIKETISKLQEKNFEFCVTPSFIY